MATWHASLARSIDRVQMDDDLVLIGSPFFKKAEEDLQSCTLPAVKGGDNSVVAKKTGKEVRREKRMKNEPQNFIGFNYY